MGDKKANILSSAKEQAHAGSKELCWNVDKP